MLIKRLQGDYFFVTPQELVNAIIELLEAEAQWGFSCGDISQTSVIRTSDIDRLPMINRAKTRVIPGTDYLLNLDCVNDLILIFLNRCLWSEELGEPFTPSLFSSVNATDTQIMPGLDASNSSLVKKWFFHSLYRQTKRNLMQKNKIRTDGFFFTIFGYRDIVTILAVPFSSEDLDSKPWLDFLYNFMTQSSTILMRIFNLPSFNAPSVIGFELVSRIFHSMVTYSYPRIHSREGKPNTYRTYASVPDTGQEMLPNRRRRRTLATSQRSIYQLDRSLKLHAVFEDVQNPCCSRGVLPSHFSSQ